ncbi:MAG: phage infection protein [Cyanobacteria bacterium SZAS-4]|nr:phage infection protein [Cyanobacteria bacterium SZAS-4]
MKKLKLELENCYGIRKLDTEFSFEKGSACALYAPNGAMKSSLARTFQDIINKRPSEDRVFADRSAARKVVDEVGAEIPAAAIFVIEPYDKQFGHSEKTSTLLVDNRLRREYEALFVEIDAAKKTFLKAMKEQTGSKRDLEKEISQAFTKTGDEFFQALIRIKDEVTKQSDAPLSSEPYDVIYDEKVVSFLAAKGIKDLLQSYIEKYNELLAASTYFKKDTFTYYNAEQIAKTLASNGFFDAKHTILLNSKINVEIKTVEDLQKLIEAEKEQITSDTELRKRFSEIEDKIHKNVNLREFQAYLQNNPQILPMLSNMEKLKEEIWKSCFKAKLDLYTQLIELYQAAEKRKREIEKTAQEQRTQWEEVIRIFNERFFVPFKLTVKNREAVMLGKDVIANLAFTFEDGHGSASIDKNQLLEVLSTGEKKAFYILNIIFEVEARKKAGQPTLFIVDDIADSFDYKNKYAIIEYLRDISEEPNFKQLILTHNFDFFRTVESRFVPYLNCKMALKTSNGINVIQATGIKNVFANDWKSNFFSDDKKKIASIAFVRNIIEYTKGEDDPDYCLLTSLLHWKADTQTISIKELDGIFNKLFSEQGSSGADAKPVVNLIFEQATTCLSDPEGINLENKIILSIATRLMAERFMVRMINDPVAVNAIKSSQTAKLVKMYKQKFPSNDKELYVLQRVMLMTPETIHVNSFMYEPILDMSDDHLRRLLEDVTQTLPQT